MAEVAAHAGVSVMTVSNVINRPHVVSEQTRQRVQASMESLNYRNNLVARSLRLAEPREIAYAVNHHYEAGNEYMDRFLHDLAMAAQASGRNLTLLAEPDLESEVSAFEILYRGHTAAGCVISNIDMDDPRPRALYERGVPFVAYGRTQEGAQVPWSWVDTDAFRGIELAVDHVASKGHTELALIGGSPFSHDARVRGYFSACSRHGFSGSITPNRVRRVAASLRCGFTQASALLSGDQPPSAFICSSDRIAAGVVLAIREAGKVVGSEIAVTGFDDTPLAEFGPIGITSIQQPSEPIAHELVRLIVDPPEEAEHILLQPELIVRSSTSGP